MRKESRRKFVLSFKQLSSGSTKLQSCSEYQDAGLNGFKNLSILIVTVYGRLSNISVGRMKLVSNCNTGRIDGKYFFRIFNYCSWNDACMLYILCNEKWHSYIEYVIQKNFIYKKCNVTLPKCDHILKEASEAMQVKSCLTNLIGNKIRRKKL